MLAVGYIYRLLKKSYDLSAGAAPHRLADLKPLELTVSEMEWLVVPCPTVRSPRL